MKEIFTQTRNKCPICKQSFGLFFLPFGDNDREKSKAYKLFQVVRCLVYGVKKERSLKQLNAYWATCGFVADNTDWPRWNTKDKVDFQCRVGTNFIDPDLIVVKPDGSIHFSYRSIAFKNLEHIEACNYFDRAYGVMVDFWNESKKDKITVDELVSLVKSSMQAL